MDSPLKGSIVFFWSKNSILKKISKLLLLQCFFVIFCCFFAHAGALQERQEAINALFDEPCAKYKIPKELALAIARQESGYHPLIINIAGHDVRPKDVNEALRYAYWALQNGYSFDVGIMQVNSYWIKKYRWPIELVLEPSNNVKIGCWILAQEIQRHGLNWKAIAYYHTPLHRNPRRGVWYARCIVNHLRNILNGK